MQISGVGVAVVAGLGVGVEVVTGLGVGVEVVAGLGVGVAVVTGLGVGVGVVTGLGVGVGVIRQFTSTSSNANSPWFFVYVNFRRVVVDNIPRFPIVVPASGIL